MGACDAITRLSAHNDLHGSRRSPLEHNGVDWKTLLGSNGVRVLVLELRSIQVCTANQCLVYIRFTMSSCCHRDSSERHSKPLCEARLLGGTM